MTLTEHLQRAKREAWAVGLAVTDPRAPRKARLLALVVLGYALSPIDLIPDFLPVIGLLDDALLIPLGLFLVVRWLPPELMNDCRRRVGEGERPRRWVWGALLVALTWALLLVLAAVGAGPTLSRLLGH